MVAIYRGRRAVSAAGLPLREILRFGVAGGLSKGSHLSQFLKIVAVARSGLGINIVIMYLTVELLGMDHRLGLVLTVISLAVWSYTVNILWTSGGRPASVQSAAVSAGEERCQASLHNE